MRCECVPDGRGGCCGKRCAGACGKAADACGGCARACGSDRGKGGASAGGFHCGRENAGISGRAAARKYAHRACDAEYQCENRSVHIGALRKRACFGGAEADCQRDVFYHWNSCGNRGEAVLDIQRYWRRVGGVCVYVYGCAGKSRAESGNAQKTGASDYGGNRSGQCAHGSGKRGGSMAAD